MDSFALEMRNTRKAGDPDFLKEARVLLEYGVECEGYWISDKFMANVEQAVQIVEF